MPTPRMATDRKTEPRCAACSKTFEPGQAMYPIPGGGAVCQGCSGYVQLMQGQKS